MVFVENLTSSEEDIKWLDVQKVPRPPSRCKDILATNVGAASIMYEKLKWVKAKKVCDRKGLILIHGLGRRKSLPDLIKLLKGRCIDRYDEMVVRDRWHAEWHIGLRFVDGVGEWSDGSGYNNDTIDILFVKGNEPKGNGTEYTYLSPPHGGLIASTNFSAERSFLCLQPPQRYWVWLLYALPFLLLFACLVYTNDMNLTEMLCNKLGRSKKNSNSQIVRFNDENQVHVYEKAGTNSNDEEEDDDDDD